MKNPKNILHVTHIDLDAIGAALAVLAKYKDDNVHTVWCNYGGNNAVDDYLAEVLKNGASFKDPVTEETIQYDEIIISDISMDNKRAGSDKNHGTPIADGLDRLAKERGIVIKMFDHHQPAIERFMVDGRPKYDWMVIDKSKCGALLTAEQLGVTEIMSRRTFMAIDAYDRFLLEPEHREMFEEGMMLNFVLYNFYEAGSINLEKALEYFHTRVTAGLDIMSEEDRSTAMAAKEEISIRANKTKEQALQGINAVRIGGINFIIYHKQGKTDDMLTNYIAQRLYEDPELHPCVPMLVSEEKGGIKVSTRTFGPKTRFNGKVCSYTINLSTMMKEMGWGGGHPQAAGGLIPSSEKISPPEIAMKALEGNREQLESVLIKAIVRNPEFEFDTQRGIAAPENGRIKTK